MLFGILSRVDPGFCGNIFAAITPIVDKFLVDGTRARAMELNRLDLSPDLSSNATAAADTNNASLQQPVNSPGNTVHRRYSLSHLGTVRPSSGHLFPAAHNIAPNDPLLDITHSQVLTKPGGGRSESVVQDPEPDPDSEPHLKLHPVLFPELDSGPTSTTTDYAAMSGTQGTTAQADASPDDSGAQVTQGATRNSNSKKSTKSGTTACLACVSSHMNPS